MSWPIAPLSKRISKAVSPCFKLLFSAVLLGTAWDTRFMLPFFRAAGRVSNARAIAILQRGSRRKFSKPARPFQAGIDRASAALPHKALSLADNRDPWELPATRSARGAPLPLAVLLYILDI